MVSDAAVPYSLGEVLIPSRIMPFSTFFKEEWSRAKRICSLILSLADSSERENEKV